MQSNRLIPAIAKQAVVDQKALFSCICPNDFHIYSLLIKVAVGLKCSFEEGRSVINEVSRSFQLGVKATIHFLELKCVELCYATLCTI